MKLNDFENIKKFIRKILSVENRKGLVVGVGILGMMLIGFSGFSGKSIKSVSSSKIDSKHTTEVKREKLEKNLENIVSSIHGAGKSKVLITFENSSETVYATEERKNKEESEDKADGEVTRKKESNDCEKKYITVKDSEGTEHALAVTEIEPKIKGVIIACAGGDNPVVKKRIIEAATTALSIPSRRVCVTKSS